MCTPGAIFKNKDAGAWSIPKGEFMPDEDPLLAAKREFEEETGQPVTGDNLIKLSPVKLKSGKTIHAWAVEGDIDAGKIVSNFLRWSGRPNQANRPASPR
ncbi:NUDIX domain-containing protein [Mucilaginibacter antarcticus]|uniref:NUDIX domain-containing protein n=1 Tax=Mucilaginibacter antarcticus TaxID=1855725 RepID=UPI003643DAB2